MKKIFNHFLKTLGEGFFIIVPFTLTFFLIFYITQKIVLLFTLFLGWMPIKSFYGKIGGVFIFFILIHSLGYFASHFIVRYIINLTEKFMMKLPVVSILYSYVKDSTTSFIERFNQPVLILFNKENSIFKIGFISRKKEDRAKLYEKILVYLPFAYSTSGVFVFTEEKNVIPLGISTLDGWRIALSGVLPEDYIKQTKLNIEKNILNEKGDKRPSLSK